MGWWIPSLAQAQAPEPGYEEMVIIATRSTRAAERALDAEIRGMGYVPARVQIGGRTQYLSAQIWKPRLTAYQASSTKSCRTPRLPTCRAR